MKIRNGDLPIPLPDIVKVGDPITAKWANGLRSAVQRLRDRTPVAYGSNRSGGAYAHPWKIYANKVVDGETTELRIYVNYGAVTYQDWSATDQPIYKENDVFFDLDAPSYLLNDPFVFGTVGYFVATANTSYGVWLKISRTGPTNADFDPSTTEPYGAVAYYNDLGACEIFLSSTFVEKSDTPTYDDDFSFIYIGKVAYDIDGNATISQHRKSDVITGMVTYPTGFTIVSGDAGNSLTTGSDNGAFYEAPPTVSADVGNDITTGSDGGAYYDDPDY